MPPADQSELGPGQRKQLTAWIDKSLREHIAFIEEDRYFHDDLTTATQLVMDGFLLEQVELPAYLMGVSQ